MNTLQLNNIDFYNASLIKTIYNNKEFAGKIVEKFDDNIMSVVSSVNPMFHLIITIREYFNQYEMVPELSYIISTLSDNDRDNPNRSLADRIEKIYQDADNLDWCPDKNYKWICDEVEKELIELGRIYYGRKVDYASDKPSIELDDLPQDYFHIKFIEEPAQSIFDEIGSILDEEMNNDDLMVKTHYQGIDLLLNGGFHNKSLNIFCAKPHGYKSGMLINIATRQFLNGYNVAIASLEMSKNAYTRRINSNLIGCDLNKIYKNEVLQLEIKNKWNDLKVKNSKGEVGSIVIGEFDTTTTSKDIRVWLKSLINSGFKPDILYIDYIGIMKSNNKRVDNLYTSGKDVAEQVRDLAKEFNMPVVSASQINRNGALESVRDLDDSKIAESYGIVATADFIIFQGNDPSSIYENELHYKCVKNRFGLKEITGKFYYDRKSLKLYDKSEERQWIDDAMVSGDDRNLVEVERQGQLVEPKKSTKTKVKTDVKNEPVKGSKWKR